MLISILSQQAIEILRTKELQPYVVFIKPPTMEQYNNDEMCSLPRLKPRLTLDRETSNGLTVSWLCTA